MKAADYIALYLQHRRVTHVFELVGGMITFLLDSLHERTSVNIVSMHHEQGAGFAAEGWGRVSGIPGVALATSGPGATNLLTAIGSCFFDSTPAVFITGQVNRTEQKASRPIRQLGFQETDIVSMARPITKAAWLVNQPEDLPRLLEAAFTLATSGRPGPVLLDLPLDVQRAEITDLERLETTPAPIPPSAATPATREFWDETCARLAEAKKPLILAGGGIRSGQATELFRQFAETLGIPVVHSLMASDVIPSHHPLRAGLIGTYGNRWSNIALSESDYLLVLGSRLDVRQTGADTKAFKGTRPIFHVDCEAGEMNNRIEGCISLQCELKEFLSHATANPPTGLSRQEWTSQINTLRDQWPDTNEQASVPGINPNVLMHQLSKKSGSASAYTIDVGQHQMWAAQSLEIASHQRLLTSGGLGAMGFSLPAAIGACLAGNAKPVVSISGDGGFQLNIQELQTIAHHQLPIKIIVINNHCHGMVRQFQESYFSSRYQSTVWGYSAPAFTAVAQAYGIAATSVTDPACLEAAIEACWAQPQSPYLLEVNIAPAANAYPKMAFGKPMSEMEPFAKPLEMEGT